MSLVRTKLFAPPLHQDLLLRPALLARLNAGLRLQRRLSMLVAPAGFGKTTLAASWLQLRAEGERLRAEVAEPQPSALSPQPFISAWLTLDAADSDPVVFASYLVAALETVQPVAIRSVAALLEPSQSAGLADVCVALINAFAALPADEPPVVLVLDDYHTIAAPAVHQALGFLAERLPPQLHLLLLSREDPPLPLARLRARGALTELRASDLHFSRAEVQAFLHAVARLSLSDDQVALLDARTEGWPAGLQLAALSLQGSPDLAAAIAAFAGDDRFVLDYLLDEVVAHQPESVRAFWMVTAGLDRMCADLCAHLVGAGAWPSAERALGPGEAQVMLEYLERRNLFLVPLDGRRQWYRYHQLFADLLRSRLLREAPGAVAALHRAASAWFAAHALSGEAIQHALAAGDTDSAAELIVAAVPAWQDRNEVQLLCAQIERLPPALIARHAPLAIAYAQGLISSGRNAEAAAALDALAPESLDPMGQIALAMTRVVIAGAQGDARAVARLAATILPWLPAEDSATRGMITFSSGLAAYLQGDVMTGIEHCKQAIAQLESVGNRTVALVAIQTLASLQIVSGELRAAEATCARALALGALPGGELLSATCPALIVLSGLHYEWNALAEAERLARRALDLSRRWGHEGLQTQALATLALACFVQGAHAEATDLLDEAAVLGEGRGEALLVLRVAALHGLHHQAERARERGALARIRAWADGAPALPGLALPASADEERRLIRAREQLSGGQARAALADLEALQATAAAAGRVGRVIEAAALQAITWQRLGDLARATANLDQALSLAAPQHYLRLFLDLGEPLQRLGRDVLQRWGDQHPWRAYLQQILAAFGGDPNATRNMQHAKYATSALSPQPSALSPQPLAEPLSEREIEVLRLVAAGLSNSVIAEQLILAPGTVKRHLHNIYGKLGVDDRLQAVNRGRELGLL
jgi:LuxR family transcriptional regulator, maltose regulon positive regulatory protein